ncbi:single-stranded DNA-binding protein [Arthrobacter sp. CAN_A1]|uniref:single-stranded DNA-binding protein n=1 Tax=Arthrobacter sp. CAN_A1 TaxID=2787717 RepID=UPI0018C8EEF6
MSDNITVRGYVATDMKSGVAESGLAYASFRMCSTERRFDRNTNTWADGQTNWYAISMFRQLATNAGVSIKKGDKVVVSGRLRVRPWIREDGRTGTSVDIDADTVGHDLMWGTAHFHRTSSDRSGGETSTAGDPLDVEAADVDYPHVDHSTGEILGEAAAYSGAASDPAPSTANSETNANSGAGPGAGDPSGNPNSADGPGSTASGGPADTGDQTDAPGDRAKSKRSGRQLTEAPY